VTLLGTSDGDTGFFDPGAGFSNRIATASAAPDVTVNSITYNNPTNVTLHLTVAGGATPGARTLTVTNPDGQSATSASGILTSRAAAPQIIRRRSRPFHQDRQRTATAHLHQLRHRSRRQRLTYTYKTRPRTPASARRAAFSVGRQPKRKAEFKLHQRHRH